ncbi:MAG: ergot alkaloid biosynthesis protein [Pseudonocardiales bacterium]|nr:ergot alkaloid biosynthesis protein [Pseudonocardiales bacterium]
MTVLVTGATGTTGRRVADLLTRASAPVRRASRSSPQRFDWGDPATHDPAFAGADRAYLLGPLADPDPAQTVRPVLERAVDRGLRRVVLLGSSAVERGGAGLGALADLVATTVPEPVVLRPSWFAQNFLGGPPNDRGLSRGRVVTATGDGRVPFVDAADIAAVAVHALLVPAAYATVLAGLDDLVRSGSQAGVTDVVERLTGRPPRSLRQVLAAG